MATLSSSQNWIRPTLVIVGLLGAGNAATYIAAPSMFEVDLAQGQYTEANNFELTRVYNRALAGYEAVVAEHPNSKYHPLARIGIANSILGLGRREEAVALYRTLLVDLEGDAEFDTHRYDILQQLSRAFQAANDSEQFMEIYAQLQELYPDSDATAAAAGFAEVLNAASVADSNSLIGVENVQFPDQITRGENFHLDIQVPKDGVEAGSFAIATNLSFWEHFQLVNLSPSPGPVSDYWGKRFFQFTQTEEGLSVSFELMPREAGVYELDLDLERDFDLLELGLQFEISVSGD